jgi:hypothetical protein
VHLFFLIFVLPFLALHFLPTIIAAMRGARNTLGIFLVNLLLSWTVIGWIVALIWSICDTPRFATWYVPAPQYNAPPAPPYNVR